MRMVAAFVVIAMLSGCGHFMTPSGNAAARWAAIEKSRASRVKLEDKTCRILNTTGSIIPQKTCSTAEEWKEFDRIQRESTEEVNRERRSLPTQTRNGEGGL